MNKLAALLAVLACIPGCKALLMTEDADFSLEDKTWGLSGMKAPKEYQELSRMSTHIGEDYYTTDASFSGDQLTLVYPGGGYRTLTCHFSPQTHQVSFDGILLHGSFGAPDITSCSYIKERLLDAYFVAFYQGEDPENIDMEKGEWRMNFAETTAPVNRPLFLLEGEYGTMSAGNNVGYQGGTRWAVENLFGDRLFPACDFDLATVHYGPKWCLPTREQAQELIDNCDFLVAKVNNERGLVLRSKTSDYFLRFVLPGNMDEELGIWLADGSALTYHYDLMDEVIVGITEDTLGRSFFVRPVRTDSE